MPISALVLVVAALANRLNLDVEQEDGAGHDDDRGEERENLVSPDAKEFRASSKLRDARARG